MVAPIRKPVRRSAAWLLAPLLWLGVGGLALANGAALLARLDPVCELFAHFPAQYFVGGAALAAMALLLRRYLALAIALGLALANLATIWPYVVAAPPAVAADGPALKLAVANLRGQNADAAALRAFLAGIDADLVVLTELAGQQTPAYDAVRERFPERLYTPGPRHQPFALLVLARGKLQGAILHYPYGVDFPIAEWRSCAGPSPATQEQSCVTILSLHPPYPGPEFHGLRDRLIGFAAQRLRRAALAGEHAIVMGDLNTTPWSPAFDLLTGLGLRDSGLGRGWRPTWPAALGVAGIPIDHVVVSPRLEVRSHALGPDLGSDHRPLLVELRLPAASGASPTRPPPR